MGSSTCERSKGGVRGKDDDSDEGVGEALSVGRWRGGGARRNVSCSSNVNVENVSDGMGWRGRERRFRTDVVAGGIGDETRGGGGGDETRYGIGEEMLRENGVTGGVGDARRILVRADASVWTFSAGGAPEVPDSKAKISEKIGVCGRPAISEPAGDKGIDLERL
jgi:hypothetical protein